MNSDLTQRYAEKLELTRRYIERLEVDSGLWTRRAKYFFYDPECPMTHGFLANEPIGSNYKIIKRPGKIAWMMQKIKKITGVIV